MNQMSTLRFNATEMRSLAGVWGHIVVEVTRLWNGSFHGWHRQPSPAVASGASTCENAVVPDSESRVWNGMCCFSFLFHLA